MAHCAGGYETKERVELPKYLQTSFLHPELIRYSHLVTAGQEGGSSASSDDEEATADEVDSQKYCFIRRQTF